MEDQKDTLSFADRIGTIRKSRRQSKRIPQVGSPTDFKHLLHIGTDSHHVDITNVPAQVRGLLDLVVTILVFVAFSLSIKLALTILSCLTVIHRGCRWAR